MIRVGLVDIETSHRERFTEILHAGEDARVVAVCPGTIFPEAEALDFTKRFDIPKVVGDPAAMANDVDVAFILGTDWGRHIERAMPFVEKKKAVFIDKPTIGSLKDCLKLERLVNENGARIVGSSAIRYARELVALHDDLANRNAHILSASAITGYGFFDYGIHAIEMLGALLGAGAESVRWLGGEDLPVFHVAFNDGRPAILTLCGQGAMHAEVASTAGYRQIHIDAMKAYRTLLGEIVKYVSGEGNRLARIEDLTESTRIALAAKQSWDNRGNAVRLTDLDPDVAGFDGAAFAAEYGARKRAAR